MCDAGIVEPTNAGLEASQTGGFRYPASTGHEAVLRLFLDDELLPDESGLEKLLEVAAIPEVVRPIVVLPDIHFKIKNFIPSGVAVALRDAVSPMLLGPPNDSMTLAWSDLDERDLSESCLDALFGSLLEELVMFRRTDPILPPERVWSLLQQGGEGVYREWGFHRSDLARMDHNGNLFADRRVPAVARIRSAFPPPDRRPTALPDFVPTHDVEAAGCRSLGVLDGGSHFVEVDVVDDVLEGDWADLLGLRPGQVLVALHTGAGDIGLIAHKHYLPSAPAEIETLEATSDRGDAFLTAYQCAANFAFANRLYTMAKVREALERSVGKPFDFGILSDAPHDMLDELPMGENRLYLHRKGAVRTPPARSFVAPHPFERMGRPFYFPSTVGDAAHLLTGPEGNPESFDTCSHGLGRRLNREQAEDHFEEDEVLQSLVDRGIRLYRYGVTPFGTQAPGSYKSLKTVLNTIRRCGLAEPIVRLRPVAILKG